MNDKSHARQMLGSLLAALVIVVVAIAIVTAKFGSTSEAERESVEKRTEERLKAQEEIRKDRVKAQEQRRKDAAKDGG
jgi:beta-lactam-binding protein with PASTA domain